METNAHKAFLQPDSKVLDSAQLPIIVCPGGTSGKEYTCQSMKQETRVQSLGQEDTLGEEMEIHSSILAWKIPWTEEPGKLQSMGLQRVEHD